MDAEQLTTHFPKFSPVGDPDKAAARQAEIDRQKAEFFARGGKVLPADSKPGAWKPGQRPLNPSVAMKKRDAMNAEDPRHAYFTWWDRKAIREQIEAAGISMARLAEETGISITTLRNNISGKCEANFRRATKIEAAVRKLLECRS